MALKIKEDVLAKARSVRVKAFLLSRTLQNKACTDDEIKSAYNMSDAEFDEAADILIQEGTAEKK